MEGDFCISRVKWSAILSAFNMYITQSEMLKTTENELKRCLFFQYYYSRDCPLTKVCVCVCDMYMESPIGKPFIQTSPEWMCSSSMGQQAHENPEIKLKLIKLKIKSPTNRSPRFDTRNHCCDAFQTTFHSNLLPLKIAVCVWRFFIGICVYVCEKWVK